MPNIEARGLRSYQNDDLRVLFARIWQLLEGASYAEETVVSFVESVVLDQKQEHQPFLRIWTTSEVDRTDIVRRLEPLDMGIELPPLLDRYIPSKSEQEAARANLHTLRPVAGTDKQVDYTPGNH